MAGRTKKDRQAEEQALPALPTKDLVNTAGKKQRVQKKFGKFVNPMGKEDFNTLLEKMATPKP